MKTLRQFLDEQNLSQRDFAASVPMSASHLSEILNGRKSPCLKVTVKIIRATGGEVQAEGLLPEHTLLANEPHPVVMDRSRAQTDSIGSADE